jgi:hypothetical protein
LVPSFQNVIGFRFVRKRDRTGRYLLIAVKA